MHLPRPRGRRDDEEIPARSRGAAARRRSLKRRTPFPHTPGSRPRSVTEENGDLAALEGTRGRAAAADESEDQRRASCAWSRGRRTPSCRSRAKGDALVAKVPLTASGIYRVHLVGAESGFENKFSPEYELRAEPDLVPQVELELPKQDLILPVERNRGCAGHGARRPGAREGRAAREDQRRRLEGDVRCATEAGREDEGRAALGFVRARREAGRPRDDETAWRWI